MDNAIQLIHPSTFEESKDYLLREWQEDARGPAIVPVMFIRYDPCPATVIVRDEMGKKWRCLREDLFVQVFHF